MSDYTSISESNDPEGMYTYIRDFLVQNNVKNTPFAVQVLRKDNGLVLIDFSTRASKLIGNEWSSNDLISNRLEYIYDLTDNIIPDGNYHCFFVCHLPTQGLTTSIVDLIRSLNIKFVYPARSTEKIIALRAFGPSVTDIKNNIKQLLDGISNM
jgi:hypothetical protein